MTAAALERELARVARRGYAAALEELEPGYAAVGAVVRGRDGAPVAAISVGGPRQRFTASRIETLGAAVRDAARRVSAALGYRA